MNVQYDNFNDLLIALNVCIMISELHLNIITFNIMIMNDFF